MRPAWLVVVLLTGCLAPSLPSAPVPVQVADRADALAFSGCVAQELDLAVDREDAMRHLPDGFTPTRPYSLARPDPTGTSAYLMLVTESCEDIGGSGPGTLLVAWLPVLPPPELALEGAVMHAVQLGAVTDRAEVASVLASWNVSATTGNVGVETSVGPGGVRHLRVDASAGDATIAMDTRVSPAERHDAPEESLRVFVARDREVVDVYDMSLQPHTHWGGVAEIRHEGAGSLFPAPLADATAGSDVSPFDGFRLVRVPLDALTGGDTGSAAEVRDPSQRAGAASAATSSSSSCSPCPSNGSPAWPQSALPPL